MTQDYGLMVHNSANLLLKRLQRALFRNLTLIKFVRLRQEALEVCIGEEGSSSRSQPHNLGVGVGAWPV